ncbi:unnamed protein product [Rhodiola kirilowii]
MSHVYRALRINLVLVFHVADLEEAMMSELSRVSSELTDFCLLLLDEEVAGWESRFMYPMRNDRTFQMKCGSSVEIAQLRPLYFSV